MTDAISGMKMFRGHVSHRILTLSSETICLGGVFNGMKKGKIHIGTSGWHYPHWVGPFYPKNLSSDQHLSFYTRAFRTVEINNTFYHLPAVSTVEHWLADTPKNFRFACKGSRFITHMKKLKNPEQSIQRFFNTITVLNKKLGPILFQLPPKWKMNIQRLEEFLTVLPPPFRYAFEFREESWFAQPVYDVLTKYRAAFCLYHLAGRWSPEIVTTDFVYIRLHGPGNAYQGKYDAHTIRAWADKCHRWVQSGRDVYFYFDNDEAGYAPINALALQNKVDGLMGKPHETGKKGIGTSKAGNPSKRTVFKRDSMGI